MNPVPHQTVPVAGAGVDIPFFFGEDPIKDRG